MDLEKRGGWESEAMHGTNMTHQKIKTLSDGNLEQGIY